MNKQKMLPQKIYLHSPNEEDDWNEMTVWCKNRYAEDDVEYIRMDVVRELLELYDYDDCDSCPVTQSCGIDGEYSCMGSVMKYVLNNPGGK